LKSGLTEGKTPSGHCVTVWFVYQAIPNWTYVCWSEVAGWLGKWRGLPVSCTWFSCWP